MYHSVDIVNCLRDCIVCDIMSMSRDYVSDKQRAVFQL